jgi:hypothetical protein
LSEEIRYRSITYHHLLIRSRWEGYPLDGPDSTSVFIRLVPSGEEVTEPFDTNRFVHVAWGMSHVPH